MIRTKNLHYKVKSSIKHKYQLGKNALVFVNMLSRANFQTYGSSDALMDEIVNFVHLQPMLEDSWLLGSIPLISIYIKDNYQKLQRTIWKYVIPTLFVNDNRQHFSLDEFVEFVHLWGLKHTKSTQYTPRAMERQASGKTSREMWIAVHFIILSYPPSLSEYTYAGMGTSPSRCLINRRRLILLPTKESLLVLGALKNEQK